MIAGPQYEPAGVQEPRCTDGYERLRCQAVRPGTGRDRGGIAVLARQGVAICASVGVSSGAQAITPDVYLCSKASASATAAT